MYKFNSLDFGDKLRLYRKNNNMTQSDLARKLGMDRTSFSRYENGERTPTIDVVVNICNELNINIEDLLEYKSNDENSFNPFNTNVLYVYYIGRNSKGHKSKYRWEIVETTDGFEVLFYIGKNKLFMVGKMIANEQCAFIDFKNYGPDNIQLEVTHVMINLGYSSDGLYMGTLNGNSNSDYIKATKKILVSKEDIEFTDEMYKRLLPTEEEIFNLREIGTWYVNTDNNLNGYE